jgi:hypothetical protein
MTGIDTTGKVSANEVQQCEDSEDGAVKDTEAEYGNEEPSQLVHNGVPQTPEALDRGAETSTQKKYKMKKSENGSIMEAAKSEALRPFVIISSSYLLYTITDGAIRMIVLQHAYSKSFSAMQVAIMFTLYELAGVFTNLVSAQ